MKRVCQPRRDHSRTPSFITTPTDRFLFLFFAVLFWCISTPGCRIQPNSLHKEEHNSGDLPDRSPSAHLGNGLKGKADLGQEKIYHPVDTYVGVRKSVPWEMGWNTFFNIHFFLEVWCFRNGSIDMVLRDLKRQRVFDLKFCSSNYF